MSPRNRLPSPATVAVLKALAEGISYGFDIMDVTELPSGTVYPILARLERRKLVQASWEDPAAHRDTGRPARKYYRLTDAGRSALDEAAERYRALGALRPERA